MRIISRTRKLTRYKNILNQKFFNFVKITIPGYLAEAVVFVKNLIKLTPWFIFIFLSSYWFGFSWAVETFLASVATYFIIVEIANYLLILRRNK